MAGLHEHTPRRQPLSESQLLQWSAWHWLGAICSTRKALNWNISGREGLRISVICPLRERVKWAALSEDWPWGWKGYFNTATRPVNTNSLKDLLQVGNTKHTYICNTKIYKRPSAAMCIHVVLALNGRLRPEGEGRIALANLTPHLRPFFANIAGCVQTLKWVNFGVQI